MNERVTRSLLQRAVYRGAGLLDYVRGGIEWRKNIDPEILALESGEACILGQLYGYYDDGLDELNFKNKNFRGEDFGFDVPYEAGSDEGSYRAYEILNELWKKELRRVK